jgi:hypothetical protein
MAHNVAHIRNGIVENVTVYATVPQQTDINQQGLEFVEIADAPIGIGWEFADGTFSNPDFTYVWSITEGRIDLVQPEAEETEETPE